MSTSSGGSRRRRLAHPRPRTQTPGPPRRRVRLPAPAVDDHSPVAYGELLPDETGAICAGFLRRAAAWFAAHGAAIEPVMTDNAWGYPPLGAVHRRAGRPRRPAQLIRPHSPGPTAKWNGSTAPCKPNGPTGTRSPATPNAPPPSPPGSSSTTTPDATPHSAATHQSAGCQPPDGSVHLANSAGRVARRHRSRSRARPQQRQTHDRPRLVVQPEQDAIAAAARGDGRQPPPEQRVRVADLSRGFNS
jgi:hypothetical protein